MAYSFRALRSIANAQSKVNAAFPSLSEATRQNGLSLSVEAQQLGTLGAAVTEEEVAEVLVTAEAIFQEAAVEVLLLSKKIALEIPQFAAAVDVIRQHAPNLAAEIEIATPAQRVEALDL